MSKLSWDTWWWEVRYLAPTDGIQSVIEKCESIYRDYYAKGLSPLQAFELEW